MVLIMASRPKHKKRVSAGQKGVRHQPAVTRSSPAGRQGTLTDASRNLDGGPVGPPTPEDMAGLHSMEWDTPQERADWIAAHTDARGVVVVGLSAPEQAILDGLDALTVVAMAAREEQAAREQLRAAVRGARRAGEGWGDIAAVVGVTRQAVHQRFGGASGVDSEL